MYKDKKVACVVLNYNDADQTTDFVRSAQECKLIDYIIVVDNCSSDDSFQLLSALATDKIIVRETNKNGGYGFGNNYGANIASNEFNAEYIIISNPDVKFETRLVQKCIDVFVEHSDAAVVTGTQVNGFTNEKLVNCAWRIPTYTDYLSCSLLLLNRLTYYRYRFDKSTRIVSVGCVPGAFLMVDAKKFHDIGGYDERIFLFCEESTLGFKISQHGYKTYLLNNEYYYHYHSTSIKKSIPKELSRHKMVLQSRLFYIKNYLQVSKLKLLVAMVIFGISTFEYKVLYTARNRK